MRDVAVIAVSQMPNVRAEETRNEVEMLMPVLQGVRAKAGPEQTQIRINLPGST